MKIKLAAALVAGTAAMTMLAGCPGLIPGTTTPSPGPSAFTFDATSPFTGEVTFDGKALSFGDANYTPVMKVKEPGQQSLSITAPFVENRYFQFKAADLTAGKTYQAVWDYTGAAPTKAADVNTIDVYVSEPASASADATDPQVKMDLEWEVGMSPDFGATINPTTSSTVNFTWNAIQNLSADYQVTVYNSGGAAQWSSAWQTDTAVSWNGNTGTETDSPTGSRIAAGAASYNIKFRKKGGTYNGPNFYGETQRIPLTIQ